MAANAALASLLVAALVMAQQTASGHAAPLQWTRFGPFVKSSHTSVGLSGDGATLAVAAREGDFYTSKRQGVWVFALKGGKWVQEGATLLMGKAGFCTTDSRHGAALSSNGNTLAVANKCGGVFVFARDPKSKKWVQQGAALVPKDAGKSFLGDSIAISGDGKTIAAHGSQGTDAFGIFVFAKAGAGWAQQGRPLAGATYRGEVGLDDAGRTLVTDTRVYARAGLGAAWVQQGPDFPAGPPKAVSGDGKIVAVVEEPSNGGKNHVQLWALLSRNRLALQGYVPIVSKVYREGLFVLVSLALSRDGSVVAVQSFNRGDEGVTYVFQRTLGHWVQDKSQPFVKYGSRLSMDSKGKTLAIGPDYTGGFYADFRTYGFTRK